MIVIKNPITVTHKEIVEKYWDYEENDKLGIKPENFTYGSRKKVYWKCDLCKKRCHLWTCVISDVFRLRRSNICPYCTIPSKKICKHKSFAFLNPELLKEWDYEKNKNIDPYTLSCGSSKKVWWKCKNNKKCNCHFWISNIKNRIKGSKCPFCDYKSCKHTNFIIDHPHLKEEWSKENKVDPYSYSSGSDYKAIWVCNNNHKYISRIRQRTRNNGSGCKKCYLSKGEKYIEDYFFKNHIKYIQEQSFNKCKYLLMLRFDFYIKKIGLLIEFDGGQHFKSWYLDHFTTKYSLQKRQKFDRIKTRYCRDNNLSLLRIGYSQLNHISQILDHILSIHDPSKPQFYYVKENLTPEELKVYTIHEHIYNHLPIIMKLNHTIFSYKLKINHGQSSSY